jgi:hypothetical protein
VTATRFVFATYCDDIREEKSGKLTLVGCYGSDLIVEKASDPVLVLPKLCAQIHIVTPVERPLERVIIRAFLAETLLGELTLPTTAFATPANLASDAALIGVMATMTFVPFAVPELPSKLRIEVETEDGILRAPALRLRFNEVSSTAGSSAVPAP